MLTALGELVLPNQGTAWTQSLTRALATLGVQDKAARQAITRLHSSGSLERERIGRRTRWRLSADTTAMLTDGAERIYGFGQDDPEWNGEWLVLLASVPERQRNERYRLAVGLNWAGFGSLGNGMWISPFPDREDEAVRVLSELAVDQPTTFVARLGALGDPLDLAARAWDLPEIRRHYDDFIASIPAAPPSDGDDAVAALILLVHRWRRSPFLDPGLPPQLLPDDWPRAAAAAIFAERRATLARDAQEWWTATEFALSGDA